MNSDGELETTTVGGGCFWCIEAVFNRVSGVESVVPGYCGGKTEDPSYEEVCSGTTGHAEVVQVTFDPAVVSFEEVLEVFFSVHDPTTKDRQGPDMGSQYRSAVFYHSDEQKEVIKRVIRGLEESGLYADPIVTEIAPMDVFHEAEEYHHEYYENNASKPYCAVNITPKIEKLEAKFAEKVKPVE